jgi:hypothetical protein
VHVEPHDLGERLTFPGAARVHDSQEGLPCPLADETEARGRRAAAGRKRELIGLRVVVVALARGRAERPPIDSLLLYHDELESMETISELHTRSPRATKRFLNSYRLLRAALSAEEELHFDLHQSRTVLLLLGVATGAPALFGALCQRSVDAKEPSDLPTALKQLLEAEAGDGHGLRLNAGERTRVAAALASVKQAEWTFDAATTLRWTRRVARFTFIEPPLVVEAKPTSPEPGSTSRSRQERAR